MAFDYFTGVQDIVLIRNSSKRRIANRRCLTIVEYSQSGVSVAEGATFSTEQAAEAAGISKSTLLRWIKQGVVPDVRRDRNNWRVFTRKDVQTIKKVAHGGQS